MIGLTWGRVRLVPYQPDWTALFEEEAAILRSALAGRILGIEHVGSIAIDGMDAKPLIDMVAAVEDLEEARQLVPVLERLGYEYREGSRSKERIFLAKGPESRRTHHLALAESTSEYWSNAILFRDDLRAHRLAATEYRRLKRELARKYPEDREAYAAAKEPFIRHLLALVKAE